MRIVFCDNRRYDVCEALLEAGADKLIKVRCGGGAERCEVAVRLRRGGEAIRGRQYEEMRSRHPPSYPPPSACSQDKQGLIPLDRASEFCGALGRTTMLLRDMPLPPPAASVRALEVEPFSVRFAWGHSPNKEQVRAYADSSSHSHRSAALRSRRSALSFGYVAWPCALPITCGGERPTRPYASHGSL